MRSLIVHLALWSSELMLVVSPRWSLGLSTAPGGFWAVSVGPLQLSWWPKRLLSSRFTWLLDHASPSRPTT
jgi:hypothetical protein